MNVEGKRYVGGDFPVHLLTMGKLFNKRLVPCAFGIKIGLYFQKRRYPIGWRLFWCPVVQKGRWPFWTNEFRSEPRVLPAVGGQNTLWPDINRRVCRGQFLWAKACSAQSVFCDVYAAAKNGLHLIRGAAAP